MQTFINVQFILRIMLLGLRDLNKILDFLSQSSLNYICIFRSFLCANCSGSTAENELK